LSNLLGRRGVGNELEDIGADVRVEIVQTVAEIIRTAHAAT
jgi:hypothetical protein